MRGDHGTADRDGRTRDGIAWQGTPGLFVAGARPVRRPRHGWYRGFGTAAREIHARARLRLIDVSSTEAMRATQLIRLRAGIIDGRRADTLRRSRVAAARRGAYLAGCLRSA